MRKTKIICTMGPSTDKEGILEQLAIEGMDVARFNFSHGDHEEQKGRLDRLKAIRTKINRPIAALLDTKGPEIRIREFAKGKITLTEGQKFTLTADEIQGDEERVSITYKELYKDVKPGDSILIDDGLIGLEVEEIEGSDIHCVVINGGIVSNKKGINLPGVNVNMPFISQKDREDILFGIQEEFDFIAASFTRTADDVLEIRKILDENGGRDLNIIAKIENQQGVDNIDSIIEVADGIMIARGDMGVEIPLEDVPVIQKEIINKVYNAGKQVITATQMLDSMMKNPRPTRAETTDVANAIYQGTSAIMLSGETAAGKYPVEALRTMVKIALRTESDIAYNKEFSILSREHESAINMTTAISHATCMTAIDLGAKAIITVSRSGNTARMISKYRPGCMIVGCSPEEHTCRQLNMSWGITPVHIKEEYSMEILLLHATEAAERAGYVEKGDVVVLTAGVPLGRSGNTNLIKATVVGEY
ncbi:MAG: pyruvate kinase [Blautia sp.]|uniref:pyruvate kinase n=1 Tax=Blautia sp. TaxID=1955243 RepID=UPI002E7A6373|nr:pyruvate kinase [Blautia sp.]MED9883367.1 pyruvate kinase [Blautia sp.]